MEKENYVACQFRFVEFILQQFLDDWKNKSTLQHVTKMIPPKKVVREEILAGQPRLAKGGRMNLWEPAKRKDPNVGNGV